MRRRILLTSLPWAPFLLAALPAFAAEGPLRVVATISILADMARQVGGDAVTVSTIVPVDGDPHEYEPKPSDLKALHDADLLIENGLGLEGWLGRMVQSSGFHGPRIISTAEVKPRLLPDGRTRDPHAWQDPHNGVLYVQAIAEGLARVRPGQVAGIRARARDFVEQIEATDREIAALYAAIPADKRKIITSHDAFGYYAARYGITMHGVQGINTEEEPSAKDIARLAAQVRRDHTRAVFVENMTDPRLAAALAREAGAVLGPAVFSDALSPPGGPADTYLKMLRYDAAQFTRAMAANE
jgi:zinc/manganese transport system substrate-binding protein